MLSRFEFNKAPNPRFQAGKFELQIAGGVQAFKAPRPQLVLLSSAGVERNALVGDDAGARARSCLLRMETGGGGGEERVERRQAGAPVSRARSQKCLSLVAANNVNTKQTATQHKATKQTIPNKPMTNP